MMLKINCIVVDKFSFYLEYLHIPLKLLYKDRFINDEIPQNLPSMPPTIYPVLRTLLHKSKPDVVERMGNSQGISIAAELDTVEGIKTLLKLPILH